MIRINAKACLFTAPLLAAIALLAACSSLIEPDSGVVIQSGSSKTLLSEDELVKYIEEWQQAKPGISRLTELESDLAFLISEVNKMSDLNTAPQRYAAGDDEVQSGDNVIVATMTGPIDASTEAQQTTAEQTTLELKATDDKAEVNKSLGYGLHLASFLKPYSANLGWYLVTKEYPTLFRGLTPRLQLVQRSNQTTYSLRVGPFSSKLHAAAACRKLMQRNYSCMPADYQGEPLL